MGYTLLHFLNKNESKLEIKRNMSLGIIATSRDHTREPSYLINVLLPNQLQNYVYCK